MTHKKIIIDKHLMGKLSKEISKSTHRNEESVEKYIEVFKSVVILYIYNLSVELIVRVLNKSQGLIEEYIEIIELYLKTVK